MSGGVKRFAGTRVTILEEDDPTGFALKTALSEAAGEGAIASGTAGACAGIAAADGLSTDSGGCTGAGLCAWVCVPEETGAAGRCIPEELGRAGETAPEEAGAGRCVAEDIGPTRCAEEDAA